MKKEKEAPTKVQPLKHPIRTAMLLYEVAVVCARIKPIFSRDFLKLVCRAARISHKERFLPHEAYAVGLLGDTVPESDAEKYYSRKKLIKVQKTFSPEPWMPVLADKCIMSRYCKMAGLRVPQFYAVFYKNSNGLTEDGTLIQTRDDWARFIVHQLPAEFVVKPTDGCLGRGVYIFRRAQMGFSDQNGQRYQAGQIYDLMKSDPEAEGYIIQQKLDNHQGIVDLTGNTSLQTLRMITFIDDTGCVSVLHTHLKMITGNNAIDNYVEGATGNVEGEIDIQTGKIISAIAPGRNKAGTVPIERHPESGNSFADFTVPCWQQAHDLALRTARTFLPIRLVGWDVAVTPNGPVLLEGNFWWSPPNQHQSMPNILSAMNYQR